MNTGWNVAENYKKKVQLASKTWQITKDHNRGKMHEDSSDYSTQPK